MGPDIFELVWPPTIPVWWGPYWFKLRGLVIFGGFFQPLWWGPYRYGPAISSSRLNFYYGLGVGKMTEQIAIDLKASQSPY